MYVEMNPDDIGDMSISDMIDKLGDLSKDAKAITRDANLLKEAIKARSSVDGDYTGKKWGVSVNTRVRHGLDTRGVREEMGEEWYEDHCMDTEYREVRTFALETI